MEIVFGNTLNCFGRQFATISRETLWGSIWPEHRSSSSNDWLHLRAVSTEILQIMQHSHQQLPNYTTERVKRWLVFLKHVWMLLFIGMDAIMADLGNNIIEVEYWVESANCISLPIGLSATTQAMSTFKSHSDLCQHPDAIPVWNIELLFIGGYNTPWE